MSVSADISAHEWPVCRYRPQKSHIGRSLPIKYKVRQVFPIIPPVPWCLFTMATGLFVQKKIYTKHNENESQTTKRTQQPSNQAFCIVCPLQMAEAARRTMVVWNTLVVFYMACILLWRIALKSRNQWRNKRSIGA